jgi:peroxiredoxin
MKKILILVCGLLAMSATAMAQEPKDETTLVTEGMDVPQFTVQMLDGSSVNIADLKGKVVVVNFWATWCPYCVRELAEVQAGLIDKFAGKDLVFIAISHGEEQSDVAEFVESKGYKFPIGFDGDSSVCKKFATQGIPRNFVIDRDGKVAMSSIGYTPEIFAEMVEFIGGML